MSIRNFPYFRFLALSERSEHTPRRQSKYPFIFRYCNKPLEIRDDLVKSSEVVSVVKQLDSLICCACPTSKITPAQLLGQCPGQLLGQQSVGSILDINMFTKKSDLNFRKSYVDFENLMWIFSHLISDLVQTKKTIVVPSSTRLARRQCYFFSEISNQ